MRKYHWRALDWLGGVVRNRFPRLSKPCKSLIAVKQLSRSLVFFLSLPKRRLIQQKQTKTLKVTKKHVEVHAGKESAAFSHPDILIYPRNGVFCG